MAKKTSFFVCNNCGARQPKWVGRCPECGEWDSLTEQVSTYSTDLHRPTMPLEPTGPIRLAEAVEAGPSRTARIVSGFGELDRVLGGGLVPGQTVLLGGAPGIGKSTLMLHLAGMLGRSGQKGIYVTSEESVAQVAMRAERLGLDRAGIWIDAQTNLEIILNHIRDQKPAVVMIDSVQLIYKPGLSSAPGSVNQMRQCATELTWLAKSTGVSVLLVGHVTKRGMIAGPKILEHIVDVVLYFEGDRHHAYRVVRAAKNRFGSTNELGIFEMTEGGLKEVADPVGLFLHREYPLRPGRVTLAASEGSRILLVEVQALTSSSIPGVVKRKGTGVDSNRLSMILAVLERHAGLRLGSHDVYVNVVGGVRVTEPAADLALALSVAGAHTGKTLSDETVVFGELGLLGEIRPVNLGGQRVAEASRHGFGQIITAGAFKLDDDSGGKRNKAKIHCCYHLQDALKLLE